MKNIILEKRIIKNEKGPGIDDIISDKFSFPKGQRFYGVLVISGSAFTDHPNNTLRYDVYINHQRVGHLEQHHNGRTFHMSFPTFFRGNLIFIGGRGLQLKLKRDTSTHAQSDQNDNWNATIYYLDTDLKDHLQVLEQEEQILIE